MLLALAALGLSMVFGTTGLTNFAHGELITFGAMSPCRRPAAGADPDRRRHHHRHRRAVIAFVVSGASATLNDAALWRPLRRRGTGLIAMMIVSIGLVIFLRNIYQYVFGADNHNYSQYADVTP